MNRWDMIEPPEHLYQEGNIISKYFIKQKKKNSKHKNQSQPNSQEKKIHKYQKEDLGNFIDVEV